MTCFVDESFDVGFCDVRMMILDDLGAAEAALPGYSLEVFDESLEVFGANFDEFNRIVVLRPNLDSKFWRSHEKISQLASLCADEAFRMLGEADPGCVVRSKLVGTFAGWISQYVIAGVNPAREYDE